MTINELEFAVFCIESIAENLGLTGGEIYKLLTEKSDILDNYIVPCNDALHTQGKEYIVNDIKEVMREKGLIV
jgi:DNA-binding phage protein